MSFIQQLEEEQYNRDDSEYLAVMRAEAHDYFAEEQSYYCEEHDFLDYDNACPFFHATPVPPPAIANDPDYIDPPF